MFLFHKSFPPIDISHPPDCLPGHRPLPFFSSSTDFLVYHFIFHFPSCGRFWRRLNIMLSYRIPMFVSGCMCISAEHPVSWWWRRWVQHTAPHHHDAADAQEQWWCHWPYGNDTLSSSGTDHFRCQAGWCSSYVSRPQRWLRFICSLNFWLTGNQHQLHI